MTEQKEDTFFITKDRQKIEVRKTKNGALQCVETGKFVQAPTTPNFTDPEYARAAINKRWEDARARAAEGLLRAVTALGRKATTPEQAWGVLMEGQAKKALKGGRESTTASRFVGESTGMLPDRRSKDFGSPQTVIAHLTHNYFGNDPGLAAEWLEIIDQVEAEDQERQISTDDIEFVIKNADCFEPAALDELRKDIESGAVEVVPGKAEEERKNKP